MKISSDKYMKSHARRLKRETESFPISAQNNAIRTNYDIAKIGKTHTKCTCDDRDERINHMICESSKLAQKRA